MILLSALWLLPAYGATVRPLGNGSAAVETEGGAGNVITIEGATELGDWNLITSVLLETNGLKWLDPWAGNLAKRFYRISQLPDLEMSHAENFRLLDHTGKSHELEYYWNDERVSAFVLIFAANGCGELESQLPAIRALQQKFEPRGVKFWMINSNPSDTRPTLASEVTRLGLTMPVLHDRAQTVARIYNSSRAAEVVCIAREGFEIFYRGAIDERTTALQGTASRNFVDEALTQFLDGKPVTVRATKPAGCDVPVVSAGTLDYSTEIAPILQSKCVVCHSPGNVAPWAMTNYAIVRDYAGSILHEISAKHMPPWHADPAYGRFQNDMSLSVEDERKLIQWVTAGAPRGTGPDPLENIPPPPPKWPAKLGEPDLIIRPPLQQIDASGVEPYRYIFVQSGLTNDVWVKASIVRPSNTRVVHHYLVWEGQNATQMASGLAGYVPGMQPLPMPEGTGLLLKKDMWLTFNLHYTPTGEPTTDQPELALWFYDTPPPKQLLTLPLLNDTFTIPPNVNEHEISAEFITPFPATLYGMSPHMHLRGARMKFEIVPFGGRRETLLSVPHYHFHWQTGYRLAEPRQIPAGTRVIVTGAFDNSIQNLDNPNPNVAVQWGDQSFDEMFIGYFDFTVP